nr:MAG TPA: hypothetical protein [Microviridae sp.]
MYQHIVAYYEFRALPYRGKRPWINRYLYISGHIHRYKQIMLHGLGSWAFVLDPIWLLT